MSAAPSVRWGPALACVTASVVACAPAFHATDQARPRLTVIVPDSVSLVSGNVVEVELHGSGFDTSRGAPANTVRIGSLILRAVPSSGRGTVIRVVVPPQVPSGGEAPPAVWANGRYPVTVSTKVGTSDTIRLAITTSGVLP